MNIIIGERCSGKTTELIKKSAAEQIYILTHTSASARCLFDQARNMGLAIPYPVTVRKYFNSNKFDGSSIRRDGILIDDADLVLAEIFRGIPIRDVAFTDRGDNIVKLRTIGREDKILYNEGKIVKATEAFKKLSEALKEV